jgi:hypothetical protein
MYQNHLKKLKDMDAYIIEGENLDDIPTPVLQGQAKTPKKSAVTSKRKAGDAGSNDETTVDGAEMKATPAKKARGHPKKEKSAAKVEEKEDSGVDDKGEAAATSADAEAGIKKDE